MFGFLNLNKPQGWTSHDCVAKVRRLLKIKKVGHGGTLDPLATGVLPIAIGKATRLIQFLPEQKIYRAKVRFGVTTTTDDLEGEVIQTVAADHLTPEAITASIPQFIGKIEQTPPAYSAIQRDGKRLYQLAREGVSVEVPSRIVQVDQINWLNWQPGTHPEVELEIVCGTGTYIRAIARDLGNLLGVGGTLAGLVRTHSCGMDLEHSYTIESLTEAIEQSSLILTPPAKVLGHLDAVSLSEAQTQRWCNGQSISIDSAASLTEWVRVYRATPTRFLGIAKTSIDQHEALILPKVVIN